jgi:single-strand DNA-binding protein
MWNWNNQASWSTRMSKDLNRVTLIGRLGQDPTAKYMPQGTLIVQFTVATSRTYKDSEGNQREDTEWTKVACWAKLAELAQNYLRKGSRVFIECRLQTRSWEDQQSGQKQYWTEVIANDVIFLDRRQDMPEDGPELDEDLAPAPLPGRSTPATPRGAARRFGPDVAPRQPMQHGAPPAAQDEGDDDLPF